MKIRIISLILTLVFCLAMLSSCASHGTPVMTLGKVEITENMIDFWLSRYKAQFEYSYGQGIKSSYGLSSLDSFWSMKVSDDTVKTYDELFSGYIYDNAKTYLCALYLFDEFKLHLPDDTVKNVDQTIQKYIDEAADGSKAEFNAILAAYGVNAKILRELYLIDEKVSFLREYLYGKNGVNPITNEQMEEYYREKYVRMKQVCIFINECPVVSSDGGFETDSDGKTKYRKMTDEENAAARKKADEAMQKINGGMDFEKVLADYDENTADDSYQNGIYMSSESAFGNDAGLQKIYEALTTMKDGEVQQVELSNGIHLIKKLELDRGAYLNNDNSDFFLFYDAGSSSYQSYTQYIKTPMFLKYIESKREELAEQMEINDELLGEHIISKARANYYY